MSLKDTPILEIIKKLQSGEISPDMLTPDQIRGSIALLHLDGATYASIATVLKCSEKTVSRRMKEIRQGSAFKFDLQDALESIGEYRTVTVHQLRRLMRIAATAKEDIAKVQASALVVKLWGEHMKILVFLGCLPPTAFKYGEKMASPKIEKPKNGSKAASGGFKIKLDDHILDVSEMLPHERDDFRKAINRVIERKEVENKEKEDPEKDSTV